MSIIEGMLEDAPEALGEMLIEAVQEKNASLVKNLLQRRFLWGKYTQRLSAEERKWLSENVQPDPEPYRLEKDYG